ncbi:KpsF/GutQ family sugar-phosphate isomerase [Parvibaculum sp.]|uniref:KpsF/GutQ family sugar-phosphate isomerase n=1 Tax=Parvibaculum sp. TaxID=2024848 RepID=UPI0039C9D227
MVPVISRRPLLSAVNDQDSPLSPANKSKEPENSSHLASAHRTLDLEIAGLKALAASLDGRFSEAVERLFAVKGRIVVTGMGKSGHIGRKIAATLASTGAPSQFVHPAEASHGDLGMITRDDAILALSWSGESAELLSIISYTKRFAIPLIAITAEAKSALGEAADIALVLPKSEEACSNTNAPTTSTTMQLALGDALAVALIERRGFTASDFRIFHPGGKLGAQLRHVSDIMHRGDEMPLAKADTPMSEALIVMSSKSLGCLGIVDDRGLLAGLVTDGDLRRHMGAGLLEKRVGEIMNVSPKTVPPTMFATEALNFLNEKKITSLFVVENGKPVGVVHVHDFLRAGVA